MVVQQNVEVYETTHIFFPSFSCLPIFLSLLFCHLMSSPSFTRSFLLIFPSPYIYSLNILWNVVVVSLRISAQHLKLCICSKSSDLKGGGIYASFPSRIHR